MRSPLLALPFVFAALLACGGSDSTGPGSPGGTNTGGGPVATTSVDLSGNRFSPAAIKVAPSANVNWTNSDGYAHNVTFTGASGIGTTGNFSSGTMSLQMPATPGTYSYQCTLHAGMSGTVQVQ
jgi:plastocyanin